MTYAVILTVLNGAPEDRRTLHAAIDIAKHTNGVVKVLVAYPRVAGSVWGEALGGVASAST